MQTAGSHRADTQHCIKLRIGICLLVSSNGSFHFRHRDRLTLVQIKPRVVIKEGNGFLQIAPVGIDQVGNFLGCIGRVGGAGGGMEVGHIGVDHIGILGGQVRFIGHPVQIILTLVPNNAVLFVGRDGDIAAVSLAGDLGKDALVGLMVVVSIFRRGLKSHMGIAFPNHIVAIGRIHHAELIGIDGYSAAAGIALELGGVDLAVVHENIGVHANGVIHPQRLLHHLGDGSGGSSADSFGHHLLHDNGQDLLVDTNLQLLCAVGLGSHGDSDIFRGVPGLTGGRIGAGTSFHGIGAVGVLDYIVGSAKHRYGLDILNLHMLAKEIHIDQRRVLHTGAAVCNGGGGNGVEGLGGQLLVDLIEYRCQISAVHGEVAVHIVDVGSDILVGDAGTLGIVVTKAEGVVRAAPAGARTAFHGHILTCQPGIGIDLISFPDIGVGVGCVEVSGRVDNGAGTVGRRQIHTDAVDHRGFAIMLTHFCLAVGSAEQGAQGDHGVDIIRIVNLADILLVAGLEQGIHSCIGSAVGEQDHDGLAVFHLIGCLQHIHSQVKTCLDIGIEGISATLIIAVDDLIAAGVGGDHTTGAVVVHLQHNAVIIGAKRKNNICVLAVSGDAQTDIVALGQQVGQQIIGSFNGPLHTGVITHRIGVIQNQHHIQRRYIGNGTL